MNREIKFRAWDKERQHLEYRTMEVIAQFGWPLLASEALGEPDRFTGLKDKNGKEIYEGDIFRFTTPRASGKTKRTKLKYRYLVVEWRLDKTRFSARLIGSTAGEWQNLNYLANDASHEVIGNIYENKELLK